MRVDERMADCGRRPDIPGGFARRRADLIPSRLVRRPLQIDDVPILARLVRSVRAIVRTLRLQVYRDISRDH
jgi:hypothetical protein